MATFKENAEILMDAYLDATLQILQKDKFIMPMAMVLDKKGKLSFQALMPAKDGSIVDTAKHLVAYREMLQKLLKKNTAYILGYDVKYKGEKYKDAITMELMGSKKDEFYLLALPYRFTLLKKKLETGEIVREK